MTTTPATGSAPVQGELWSARAQDWADHTEPKSAALFEAGLDALELTPGQHLADLGCGAGGVLRRAVDRGLRACGLDAAPALAEIAAARVPEARVEVGDLESLPLPDDEFDAVTGFNSFQYAADPVRAVTEAGRVAKAGARVLIATWGQPEDCEAAAYLKALGSLMPPPPPGTPGPFALSEPGRLEELAADAGLTPGETHEISTTWRFADRDTLVRALSAAGPAVKAIGIAGEDAVASAVAESLSPFRSANGSYTIENTWRFHIARS